MPGVGDDRDVQPSSRSARRPPGRARRGRCAAGRSRRRGSRYCHSSTSSPISTSWPLRAPAARSAASSSSPSGAVADDAEAAVGAVDPVGAPRRRLRPVHEELGQLRRVLLDGSGAAGQSRKSARFSSSIPAPVAHETGKTPTIRSSSSGKLGRLRAAGRSCSARSPAAARRGRRRRRELAVDRAEPLLDVPLGRVDHVQEQPRALEVREELVAEPDALARALDQARARRRRSAARRPGDSTVPSTGASVVNG